MSRSGRPARDLIPAATLLRHLPGRQLVITPTEVAHLYATEERVRCGVKCTEDMRLVDDVDDAPPVKACARCVGSLRRDDKLELRPTRGELAALHGRQARVIAQRCIDDLEEIRRRMRLDGSGTVPTELIRSTPARNPLAPRPTTRTARYAQQSGHVAVAEQLPLARLLNLLTPGGYSSEARMYLINPPAPGTRVDPQVRR